MFQKPRSYAKAREQCVAIYYWSRVDSKKSGKSTACRKSSACKVLVRLIDNENILITNC